MKKFSVQNSSGFSIVEVLVSMAIIVGIAITAFQVRVHGIGMQRNSTVKGNLENLSSKVRYMLANDSCSNSFVAGASGTLIPSTVVMDLTRAQIPTFERYLSKLSTIAPGSNYALGQTFETMKITEISLNSCAIVSDDIVTGNMILNCKLTVKGHFIGTSSSEVHMSHSIVQLVYNVVSGNPSDPNTNFRFTSCYSDLLSSTYNSKDCVAHGGTPTAGKACQLAVQSFAAPTSVLTDQNQIYANYLNQLNVLTTNLNNTIINNTNLVCKIKQVNPSLCL